jgi:hypothetical protein
MSRGGHPVAPLGSPDFPSTARSGTGSTPFSPFRVRLIADADLVVGGCMDSTRIALKDSVLWADEWSSFFPEVTFDTHKGTCCATAAH